MTTFNNFHGKIYKNTFTNAKFGNNDSLCHHPVITFYDSLELSYYCMCHSFFGFDAKFGNSMITQTAQTVILLPNFKSAQFLK